MIQLTHNINPEAGTLTLYADEKAQSAIRELLDEEGPTSVAEAHAVERIIANSELQWVSPSDTGDLTDAPMLGILGEEQSENSGPYGAVHVGRNIGGNLYQPILDRWGYEPYQIRSFLSDLCQQGKAVFQNSW